MVYASQKVFIVGIKMLLQGEFVSGDEVTAIALARIPRLAVSSRSMRTADSSVAVLEYVPRSSGRGPPLRLTPSKR